MILLVLSANLWRKPVLRNLESQSSNQSKKNVNHHVLLNVHHQVHLIVHHQVHLIVQAQAHLSVHRLVLRIGGLVLVALQVQHQRNVHRVLQISVVQMNGITKIF